MRHGAETTRSRQFHPHQPRRRRKRRLLLLRSLGLQNPEHRPAGPRRDAVHQLLRRAAHQRRIPRRTAHGVLPQPHRLRPCAQSGLPLRHQRRGGDHRRSAQKTRLRHGDLRQMAPRRRQEVPASAARVRRVVRTALLERHVALPPQMEVPRPADLRRQRDTGLQPRPDHAHHGLHRAEREVHPREQGAPLLPLSGPLDAARAAGRLGQIQGKANRGFTAT